MPEQDLTDLDRAFVELTRDFARVSRPGDAHVAMRAARHRSWAKAGVAGAAAITVGTAAVWALPTGSEGGEPTVADAPQEAARALPDAAKLTTDVLDAATAGWRTGWQPDDNPNVDGQAPAWFPCPDHAFEPIGESYDQAGAVEDETFFRIDPERRLSVIDTNTDSATTAAALTDQVRAIANSCRGARATTAAVTTYPDGRALAYRVDYGDQTLLVWYVNAQDQMSLAVMAEGGGAPLARGDIVALSDALVADALAPSSYEDGTIVIEPDDPDPQEATSRAPQSR